MKCLNCGRIVPEDSVFCTYCGTPIEIRPKKKKKLVAACASVVLITLVLLIMGTRAMKTGEEPESGTILFGEEQAGEDPSSFVVNAPHDTACLIKLKDNTGSTELVFYVRAGESATVAVPSKKLQVYIAKGKTWEGQDHLFGRSTVFTKGSAVKKTIIEKYGTTNPNYESVSGNNMVEWSARKITVSEKYGLNVPNYQKDVSGMIGDYLDFENYTFECSLYPVTNGNYTQIKISSSDF